MSKITRTTIKSFVKKHLGNGLHIREMSRFSGLVDGLEQNDSGWCVAETTERSPQYSLGVKGLHLVGAGGSGGDYFTAIDDGGFMGFDISNCCGQMRIGIKKG